MLQRIHRHSWQRPEVEELLGDRTYFDALRVDPYYRRVVEVHPELRDTIHFVIGSLDANRLALVHGDFSPKNLLVWDRGIMLIDFEVGHFGDPAFDIGFFLSHLVLKAIWAGPRRSDYLALMEEFWKGYGHEARLRTKPPRDAMTLEQRSIMNLAACLLARVDGKSPVDYLWGKDCDRARDIAIRILRSPPETIGELIPTLH